VEGNGQNQEKKERGFADFCPQTDKYCHTIEKLPPGNS